MRSIARIIIIVVIFLLGVFIGKSYTVLPDTKITSDIGLREADKTKILNITASLMLDFGDGEVNIYNNVELEAEASAFDLLKKASEDNDILLEYKDYGGEMGVFIASIGEAKSDFDTNKYWQFWVNNEYAQVGASLYELNDGDVVEWKYVRGQIE